MGASRHVAAWCRPDLSQDNVPVKVTERLYFGSLHAAFNEEGLVERNITHVLNLSGMQPTFASVRMRERFRRRYVPFMPTFPAEVCLLECGHQGQGFI